MKPHIDLPIIRGSHFIWRMLFRIQSDDPFAIHAPISDFDGRTVHFRAAWPGGVLRKRSDVAGGGIRKVSIANAEAELALTHVETRSLPKFPQANYELWLDWESLQGYHVETYSYGFLKTSEGINDDVFDPVASLGDDLVAWWHVEDLTDGPVASWTDRKQSLVLTQSTAAAQPVKSSTAFNGSFPGLVLDGVDDFLSMGGTATLPVGADEGEIFALFQPTTFAGRIFGYGGGTDGGRILRPSGPNFAVSTNGTDLIDATALVAGQAYIGSGMWLASPASQAGTLNGADTVPASMATPPLSTNTSRTRYGADLGASATAFFPGVLSDVLVTRKLTLDKRQRTQGYLAWTRGLETSLPLDHPYRHRLPPA